MKTFQSCRTLAALAVLIPLVWPPAAALAQGSTFTYQGVLQNTGTAYTGVAEFQPTLWDAATGGSTVAANTPATVQVGVTNGLFVLPLNFGSSFPGAARWLQLEVRTVIGPFTPLLPRQALTATPYALTASNLSGPLPAAQLTGTLASGNLAGSYGSAVTFNNAANSFTGNGSGLTGLNASQLASGTVPDARLAANVARTNQVWLLGGNNGANGAFLGTTDTNALEFRVNGQRVMRIAHATNISVGYSPNIVGGHPVNVVSNGFVGAVIGGGGNANEPNRIGQNFATVVGGSGNTASGWESTAMGFRATASGDASTAMGNDTTASGSGSTAMGLFSTASGGGSTAMGIFARASGDSSSATGYQTTASGGGSTAMGSDTTASGASSTAMGNATTAGGMASTAMGFETTASGNYSTAMGRSSIAQHHGTFVWADNNFQSFASTGTNQFLIRASGGVGIGHPNPSAPLHVTGGTDASLTGGGHLILGRLNEGNLVLDGNEIMARDFGSAATLFLNFNGGDVQTGSSLGVGRAPAANALEVAGNASKSAAGSWLANSDARIKRDITPVTDALATLDRVRLVSFDYTAGYRAEHPEVEARRHLNVIAQEFREVFPEHVKSSGEKLPDGSEILQVDTYPLTIYSAAAVQELNRKLKSLEAQNAALLRRLEAMEARMK